jgi:hypothetical protein
MDTFIVIFRFDTNDVSADDSEESTLWENDFLQDETVGLPTRNGLIYCETNMLL